MPLLVAGILLIVDLAIRIAALIVIPRDRKPTAATAWLLAIFLIPYIGIAAYLLIGNSKLPQSRRNKQKRINEMLAVAAARSAPPADRASWPTWFASVVEMTRTLGSTPMVGGNEATLLGDYNVSIDLIADEIDAAIRFVHVEYYIISFDDSTRRVFAALEAAVKRGVRVRILLDHVSSIRAAGHKATFAELDRIGVSWSFMLPVQPLKRKYQRIDLRNHRKIVVVDGRVGFMGSQNLIARNYNSRKNIKRGLKWQELVTRVTGPVVVGMNAIFLGDWYSETDEFLNDERDRFDDKTQGIPAGSLDCQILPSGPGYDEENNLRVFLALLYSAQQKIIITSPYFVPDEAMMYAITSSVKRGLEVQLFVSAIGDQGPVYHAQRSYYGALLRAGVRIFLYPAPYILHAKHFSIDDDVAVIGSSNMDIRSFALDLEVSLMVRGRSFVDEMRRVEAEYRAVSHELTLGEWENEPRSATFLDGLARLTSALE